MVFGNTKTREPPYDWLNLVVDVFGCWFGNCLRDEGVRRDERGFEMCGGYWREMKTKSQTVHRAKTRLRINALAYAAKNIIIDADIVAMLHNQRCRICGPLTQGQTASQSSQSVAPKASSCDVRSHSA